MKILAVLIAIMVLMGCGLNERMKMLEAGHRNADSLMNVLASDSAYLFLPETNFKPNQIAPILETLRNECDWKGRRGKFIDYYTMTKDNVHDIAYIYEYFLNCDSLRFVLVYHADGTSPELYSLKIEPIETENPLLVDPMKSILKDKDWDQKKK